MEPIDVRWSVRRSDRVRVAVFLVATAATTVGALGLWSIDPESSRVFPVLFTAACLAGGALLGLVLSIAELVTGARVDERTGASHDSAVGDVHIA